MFFLTAKRAILNLPRVLYSSSKEDDTTRTVTVPPTDGAYGTKNNGTPSFLDRSHNYICEEPFISIVIATYNEENVISGLMDSIMNLRYNKEKFEVIVVDDSVDNTFSILKTWETKIQNLKLLRRQNRRGWKGGALNYALEHTSNESSYVLVVDADNILLEDTLESFVQCFSKCNSTEIEVDVIQGYPVPCLDLTIDTEVQKPIKSIKGNWISRAVGLRLAKRNLVEFVAKNELSLPVQVTGSLFMARLEVIKSVGFSEDLSEDWDLTLALHFSPTGSIPSMLRGAFSKKIQFIPSLNSRSYSVSKFMPYFRQRMRVSEGHTRSFRKKVLPVLNSAASIRDKIEFLLMGLQYSKFLAILGLVTTNIFLVYLNGVNFLAEYKFMGLSLSIQISVLLITAGIGSIPLENKAGFQTFHFKDYLSLLLLNLCTFPAFVIGSVYGLLRDQGTFYRTERK